MSLQTGRVLIKELLREMAPGGRLVALENDQGGRCYLLQLETARGVGSSVQVPKRAVDRARHSPEQRLALRNILQAELKSMTARGASDESRWSGR
jgi:hypothetical protein